MNFSAGRAWRNADRASPCRSSLPRDAGSAEFHHCFAVAGIEVSGGLVGEQDRRLSSQRAGDGNTLLLAARKLRWIMSYTVRHADSLQCLHDAPFAISRRHFLTVGQWQFDVFVDGEITNQIEALKDEANLLVPNARPLSKIKILDCLSVQRDSGRQSGYPEAQ